MVTVKPVPSRDELIAIVEKSGSGSSEIFGFQRFWTDLSAAGF